MLRERLRLAGYQVIKGVFWITLGLPFRLRVKGRENVPRDGGAILAANHRHAVDPEILGAAAPRPVSWMAKAELLAIPVLGRFLETFYVFPIHRGQSDRAALRKAQQVLSDGGMLGMFPEGTRQPGPGMGPVQPGAAMLSVMSGAPIVPAAVVGTDRIKRPGKRMPRFPRVEVRFAEPVYPDPEAKDRRQEIQRLTEETVRRIDEAGGFA
jgi:1-acyl-sn-glycerol-3-phosphate acyltransferase